MFAQIYQQVQEKTPLVHNITNYVTVNDCANVLLAAGASPIMSDEALDVEDITSICNALNINIGTLNTRTIEAMRKAGKRSNALGHVTVLDPVGAGASKLRTDTTYQLLDELQFTVIRGNVSEIKTIQAGSGTTKGVDADLADRISDDNLAENVARAKALSAQTGAVIVITGAIDIVCDSKKAYVIRNGHPFMSRVSGTGCMLSALIAAYCAANPAQHLEAAAAAVVLMGLAGQRAYARVTAQQAGTGSFRVALIDEISLIDAEALNSGAKIETC